MKSALIVLLAGRGMRFGGPKQLEPVGTNGECIAELSVRDAALAGFTGAILVIREEHRALWEAKTWPIPTSIAIQHQALGTGDALGIGMKLANSLGYSNWAVANGDDYYGPIWNEAYRLLALGLNAALAYPLKSVCSQSGSVSRAILHQDEDRLLTSIEELQNLYPEDAARLGNPWVSMNAWVFQKDLLQWWTKAQMQHQGDGEFGIPDALRVGISMGASIEVAQVGESWIGMTHAADKEAVLMYFKGS